MDTIIFGQSTAGKSMLSKLNTGEMAQWSKWADEHPGQNGMDWPGWAEVRAREALAIGCDPTQAIAGSVYHDAFVLSSDK